MTLHGTPLQGSGPELAGARPLPHAGALVPSGDGGRPFRATNHLRDALLSLAATLAVGLTLVAVLYLWAPDVEWPGESRAGIGGAP